MKRLFFLLTFFLIILNVSAFAANSPIDKGSKIIGVSGFFMHQSGDFYEYENKKIITIHLSPNIFFFTSKGMFLGPEIMYYKHSRYNYEEKQYGIGPRLGFILNKSMAYENNRQYSLYYFSLFTTYSKFKSTEPYMASTYDRGFFLYDFVIESSILTYGIQIGSYNMINSRFAIDTNIRLSVDKNNNKEDFFEDKTGYTIMLGIGLVGFSF